jgi:hypothetical protein
LRLLLLPRPLLLLLPWPLLLSLVPVVAVVDVADVWLGLVVWLVSFSSLFLLLFTTHIPIFACRVCSGASPVLGGADASYCCSSPAIGRAIFRGGGEIGGGPGCRVVFFFNNRQFTVLPHKKTFITVIPHKKFFITVIPQMPT